MKRALVIMLSVLFLVGCSRNQELDNAMALRTRLLQSNGCSFDAIVTADYGDAMYSFSMHCEADKQGQLRFSVSEPTSIMGITGYVSNEGGKLTFDDQLLAFPLMADGLITPVSAPWLLVKTLRSGYITACGKANGQTILVIDDSYQENPLHLEIMLDQHSMPVFAEFIWKERRILSAEIINFVLL